MAMDIDSDTLQRAAAIIAAADTLLVGAGAGMGVDSGLPDFRGNEGFWRAYPQFAHLGLSFADMANPRWFHRDPARAWGFYGHRYNLYRATAPHAGFAILQRWMAARPAPGFVFTSNVDGQFQRAGFADASIMECHGSINHLQCLDNCEARIWPADLQLDVDMETLQAQPPLPACPACGGLARPNILMFGDAGWNPLRCDDQQRYYGEWLERARDSKVAVIEVGAGTAVPTVRYECEAVAARLSSAELIRINPRDIQAPPGSVVLAAGASQALMAIDRLLVA